MRTPLAVLRMIISVMFVPPYQTRRTPTSVPSVCVLVSLSINGTSKR